MRDLPLHPEDGRGPKSITVTPEMAKHNRGVHRNPVPPMGLERMKACTPELGACPRKKSLKNNALKLRRDDFKISHFPETRVLTGGQNFCTFLKNC
jgi:hypothetical protein